MVRDVTSPAETTPDGLHDRSRLAAWLAGTLGQPGPPQPLTLSGSADDLLAPAARRVERLLEWATTEDAAAWEAERVRLVVNAPGGIALPLEASWWIDGEIGGPTTEAVAAFQREDGLIASRKAGLSDSLPALLESMHVLVQHQRAATLTGQPELALRARAREAELLHRFLAPWIPRACATGRATTESPWWRAVLSLLESLVSQEQQRLEAEAPQG